MIKNIIFDLGAVILDISLDAYVDELKRLAPNANFEFDHNKHAFYAQYEKGDLQELEFFENMQSVINANVTIDELKKAWSKILLNPYSKSKDFIDNLSSKLSLFILSNTNYSHRVQFDHIFNESWGENEFYNTFHQVYYSYKMGLIKPDKAIFEQVLQLEKIEPEQTLFIDDNAKNIKAAKELGLRVWHFKGPNDWEFIKKTFSL